ncbi:MAG: hypothetical protein WCH11_02465 [Bdellovibrio sp.]
MQFILIIFVLVGSVGLLSGCANKKEADKVVDAQACLNASSQGTALDCVSKVEGLDSSAANTIRCAAIFIRQGFSNPTFVAQAANQVKSGSGKSATLAIMTAFEFKALASVSENYTMSQDALKYCSQSGSKGLGFLATSASLATTSKYLSFVIVGACGSAGDTAAQLTCLKTQNNTTADAAVGTVVAAAYQTNCQGTQAGANKEFCSQFATATAACASTNYTCIGSSFLEQY